MVTAPVDPSAACAASGAFPRHPVANRVPLAGRQARLAELADEIAARRDEVIDGLVAGAGKTRRVAAR